MRQVTFRDSQAMDVPPEQRYDRVGKMIRHKADALLAAKIHMAAKGGVF